MNTDYAFTNDWKWEVSELADREFRLPLLLPEPPRGKDSALTFYRGFTVPESDECSAYYLRLSALSGDCEILIDGRSVARRESLYAPYAVEVTAFIEKGAAQTLTLRVRPAETPDGAFCFGGAALLGRSSSRFDPTVPAAQPLTVKTDFLENCVSVTVRAAIVNPNNYDIVRFRLIDPKGNVAEIRTEKPTAAETTFTLTAPTLWDEPRAPFRYRVEAALQRDAAVLDTAEIGFGIRRIELEKGGIFRLNELKLPLGGVTLQPEWARRADAELLSRLDANCVCLNVLTPDMRLLDVCDEQGVVVFFSLPPAFAENDAEIAGLSALFSQHPGVCFFYCPTPEMPLLKSFTSSVRRHAHDLFTAGDCKLPEEESLADIIPDVLALRISDAGDAKVFFDLENRVQELFDAHPDYRFAVIAEPPECIFDRHSVRAVRPDCSQEYFSMWHEKIWRIFYDKRSVIAFFAGPLTDAGEKSGRTGLVTADGDAKKDAFWFYRAQFSADGFVKLCSSDRTSVTGKYIDVKCYTNTPPITLTVNGKTKKKYRCDALSETVYVFRNVRLRRRNNTVVISAASGTDSEVVFRSKSKLSKT